MEKKTNTCEGCGDEFEYECYWVPQYCPQCAEEKAMAALSQVEPPEGGWPRGSDMDRL